MLPTLPSPARLLRSVLAALACACAGPAFAVFPDKPITLVVPFAPGGSSDNIARTIAPLLAEKLGQQVLIDNVGGAGGVLGTQKVVRATADGYTILLGSGSEILINKLINPALGYDAMRELAPVSFVGTGPMVVLGKPTLPANSIADLFKLLRAHPASLSYGSAGNGTPMHVAGELMKMRAGVFMTHIPYRGAAPALADLLGGQIDVAIATLSAANAQIKAGKVKVLATTGAAPTDLAPGVPAMGQLPGLAGFDLSVWFGIFVPARTPADATHKIQAAAAQVLADPQIRKRLAEQGIVASGESAESLLRFMASEAEKYRAVVKAAHITAE